jgi:hypothetical protein
MGPNLPFDAIMQVLPRVRRMPTVRYLGEHRYNKEHYNLEHYT